MAGNRFSGERVELEDVIFAIASDVGLHWKSLVDLLGMDARRDVQRIQHECSKAQEGSSSMNQRCAEHMFTLWRSRLAQSGVPDRQAADSLIFALQIIPQLAHLADKCKDMLGLKSQTSQAEMDEQLFLTGDSGMFSSVELSETAASTPTTQAVQDRTPSLQQGQYNPTRAGSTMTATPTSVSPSAHGTTTVSQLPSRVSPSVVPTPRTNQYHSPGMTNVNSFEPDEPPPQPEPRASGRSVTSGGAPLPTSQQVSGVSRATPENHSSLPPDYPSLSDSAASQQSSSAPSKQPQLPQPPLVQATSLPVAPAVRAQSVTVGQDQQLPVDSPKSTLATPGLQPAFTTDGTHPSAAIPGCPSNLQLAFAERDRGLRVGQEDGTATTHLPTGQAGKVSTMMGRQDSLVSQPVEGRRPARLQSYGVESASQGVSRPVQQQSVTTPTYPSALGPDGPSLPQSALVEHDRWLHETQAHATAATANPPQQTLQGVELEDVIFAIASDVGRHWKSLVDLLGMNARRDVQRIQHECSKAQEGSSSMNQRCAEHMFVLWRSRLAQSGVPDRQAADSLIFALQTIPQLAHLADKCKDMLVSTMMERQDSLVSQPVEDRRPARLQSYGMESTSQGVSRPVQQQPMTTPTCPSALGPDGPSLPQSALAEHDRRLHEAQAHATANPPQQAGQEILTLTGESVLLIWYKLRNKPLLKSIEWSSLSAELVGKHFSLFTNVELDALTADNTPQFKDIVTSALRRNPQAVLFALYKSLLDTQGCGGAAQHASIAEEIQKETLATPGLQPAFTTDGTHPSAAVPGYPSNSQLASAEHDRGLRVEQEDGTATTYHPTWQTGKVSTMMERQDSLVSQPVEDRRPARFQYYGVESASQGLSQPVQQQPMTTMSNTYSSAPDPDGPPLFQSASAEHDRSLHEAQAPATADTANPPQQTEQAESRSSVKQEAWQEIVAFIQSCMKTAPKDVLPSILREVLGGNASKSLRSNQGKQILSETLETLVQDRKMTWFQFAQYLIRAPSTRLFIFAIGKHNNHATIRYDFKKVLKKHLGSSWQQLARRMGVPKGGVDAIAVKYPNELPVQVDEFLNTYKFPYVGSDKETADLLIDILMSASLTPVATNVKRDLEFELDLEDIGSTGHCLPHRVPMDKCQAAIRNFAESFSAEPAPFDDSPGQQENEMKVLQYGHLGYPEARQYPPPKPELKACGDSDWQESRKECATEFNTSKQLVATASSQIPAEWTAATDHECGAWDGNVTIVLDTQDDNVSAIFAWFEDQMNEDELFQKISDRTYPGSLLVRQEDNKHLIHFAAERGYARVVESLLQTGYSIDVRTKNGQSPFLLACEAGHEDMIRYLLSLDPRLASTKDALDRSCLHWPAILRNENLMSDLIYINNADVDAKSKTGIIPLSVACIMGELPIVHFLLQAMRLKLTGSQHVKHRRNASRLPPLLAAAFGGHQHIMEYLLSLKVDTGNDHDSILELNDPEVQSDHAYTALHIAACRGYKAIVEMLVEKYKCMVNTSTLDKTTPLLLAAGCGHEDVVKYLLEHGAIIDSIREVRRGTFQLTPLGEAALGRHAEVMTLLLDKGADISFKAGGTTSILALACTGGDEEIVQMLLSKLKDDIEWAEKYNELHKFFEMPFVMSMDFENFKCAKLLMDCMNDKVGSIDVIIRTFTGKVKYHMIELLRQYRDMIDPISGLDLSNQGDTCRHVAGSRTSAMYHLCYDDGPHWATEPMQLCFMFETFSKPETFHTTYEKVYMEASKCILQTLVHVQDYTYETLAGAALERGSEQAASFFAQYGVNELKDRVLFLEHIHSGNPSAMGLCCELVSAAHLQETYMSEMAGPVAQQYFLEMSRRELKHPGQFRMKFSTHGSRGTGLRLHKRLTEKGYMELYQKAINNKPTIKLHVAKAMTVGSPRVGKTCLRYLLLGLPPPSVSASTTMMEKPTTIGVLSSSEPDVDRDLAQRCGEKGHVKTDLFHLSAESGKDKWVVVKEASSLQSLLGVVEEDLKKVHNPGTLGSGVISSREVLFDERMMLPDMQITSQVTAPMIPPTPDVMNRIQVASDEQVQKPLREDAPLTVPVLPKSIPQDDTTTARQILQFLEHSDVQNIPLRDAKLLLFMDCGGQLAYHDILPLFISSPSIYLHVFNLTEDLNECPTDRYHDKERELYSEARSPVTTAQMICRSMMTIKSVSCKKANLPEDVMTLPFEPIVMLVGTHLDVVEKKCKESAQTEKRLKEVSNTLWKTLTSTAHGLEEMVQRIPTPPLPSMFFPVNNKLYAEESEGQRSEISVRAIEYLRKKVSDLISDVKVEVPVRWYVFQLMETSQKWEWSKPVYRYGELYQSCRKELTVDDLREFDTMVTYFNALGLFVHLCEEDGEHTERSNCFIFTVPTYLSEIISKLYQVHFLEEDRCGGGLRRLKQQGILTIKSLQDLHVDEHYLKHRELMGILVQLFIGATIEPGNGDKGMELFIPSVLMQPAGGHSGALDLALRESQLHFVFTFKDLSFIPCGVFAGIITRLIRLQSAKMWKICLKNLYRFHMRFGVGAHDFVSLFDCATHIVVVMEVKDKQKAVDYRDTILDAAAESNCFLYHDKDHHSAPCHRCYSNPLLTLGLKCYACAPEDNHIAELHVENSIPATVRCQETLAVTNLNAKQQLLFQNMEHYAVVHEQHTRTNRAEPKVASPDSHPEHASHTEKWTYQSNEAALLSVSEFLAKHETEFFKVVNPRQSLLRLIRKSVITEDVKSSMDASNTKDALEILYDHLKRYGNVDMLLEYCEMAIDADGLPNMQSFGRRMKEELQPGGQQTS